MFITVTMQMGNKKYDLKIDNNQPIINSTEILKQSRKYDGETAVFYRSKISENVISAYLTFLDAGIYSGDILEAIFN